MSTIELLILLIYFLLVHFTGIGITAVTLACVVGVMILVRILQGQPIFVARSAPPST